MPFWETTAVHRVPRIRLEAWCAFELDEGTRHFVGYNVTEREGRVSSAIKQFDAAKREGLTRSRRVYELIGRPGYNADAMDTWSVWCFVNRVFDARDVSDKVWAEMRTRGGHRASKREEEGAQCIGKAKRRLRYGLGLRGRKKRSLGAMTRTLVPPAA